MTQATAIGALTWTGNYTKNTIGGTIVSVWDNAIGFDKYTSSYVKQTTTVQAEVQASRYDGYAISISTDSDHVCVVDEDISQAGVFCAEFTGSTHSHWFENKSFLVNSSLTATGLTATTRLTPTESMVDGLELWDGKSESGYYSFYKFQKRKVSLEMDSQDQEKETRFQLHLTSQINGRFQQLLLSLGLHLQLQA